MEEIFDAAEEAHAELEKNLGAWPARDMDQWWKEWYLCVGHKHLDRILVDHTWILG